MQLATLCDPVGFLHFKAIRDEAKLAVLAKPWRNLISLATGTTFFFVRATQFPIPKLRSLTFVRVASDSRLTAAARVEKMLNVWSHKYCKLNLQTRAMHSNLFDLTVKTRRSENSSKFDYSSRRELVGWR